MANMRRWSHEFMVEFIELYRSLPCLYDIKSKQYLNKPLKLAAYDMMVEKLKTVDAAANKDTVVKKINNMRSSYRKELKKVNESKRSGGEVYETSLWYFHLLDFLYEHEDQEIPKKTKFDMVEIKSYVSDDDEEGQDKSALNDLEESVHEESIPQNDDENILSPSTSSVSTSSRRRISKRASKKLKVTGPDRQHRVLKLVTEKCKSQNKYLNYAAYVGQELDALPPMMATYCQKIINDALFNAKCGQLTAQSRVVSGSHTSDN